MNVTLRAGRPEDAERCGRICYDAFTTINREHGFPPDFPNVELGIMVLTMMLNHPQHYTVVAECDEICWRVHGHVRSGELRDAIAQGAATLVEHGGRVVGYCTGIAFFSHAVAESNTALQALIGAVPGFLGPGFLVPSRNAEL